MPINAEEALYVDPDALAAARPSLLNALLPEDSSDECAQWVADAKDGCGGDHPAKDAVRVLGACSARAAHQDAPLPSVTGARARCVLGPNNYNGLVAHLVRR